ncbi:MAG: TraB/GumN family protein [Candidatus Woesearchaeota archaeon]|nr:TraB/GumN family protein [Candidatus Woesearchaeota archaeon]
MKHVILLGTSHIAEESVRAIESAIEKHLPDIVAVELDAGRLEALTHKQRRASFFQLVPRVGVTGAVFALIGAYMQKRLGAQVGVLPGADMLAAVRAAQKRKLQVFLIDQNIEVTLARFSQQFTLREKMRLLGDILMALFFPQRQMKKYGVFTLDLSRVPSTKLIARLIREIKKRYPSLYRVLIQERNEYMAYQLVRLLHLHPDKKILAVVGAGHEEGMRALLQKINK